MTNDSYAACMHVYIIMPIYGMCTLYTWPDSGGVGGWFIVIKHSVQMVVA